MNHDRCVRHGFPFRVQHAAGDEHAAWAWIRARILRLGGWRLGAPGSSFIDEDWINKPGPVAMAAWNSKVSTVSCSVVNGMDLTRPSGTLSPRERGA